MDQRGYNLQISWEVLWRIFLMALLGWVLFLARDVVVSLILAIVISTAFHPIVSYLEERRVPRILGTLSIYLVAVTIIGFVLYLILPVALQELGNLLDYSGEFFGNAFASHDVQGITEGLDAMLSQIKFLASGELSLADLTAKFLGGIISVIAIFALSFYLTVGRDGVEKLLIAILPSAYEERAFRIYTRVAKKIGKWLTGQLFVSLIVGVATFLGLWLLGVKYSLFLGLLAAVTEIIPYVGPIFTGGIALIIGFNESFNLGIYAFILFAVIQQIENHLLLPSVMRYTTALNPALVLTALLIGGKVFGIVGLILAVPIAVFFQELTEDWVEAKQAKRGLSI